MGDPGEIIFRGLFMIVQINILTGGLSLTCIYIRDIIIQIRLN